MTSPIGSHSIQIIYWIVIVALSAFFLRQACSICAEGMPTWKRSIISVLLVSFLSYLVFDFTCYLIMRSMNEVLLYVPPGYSYALWFREPFGIKWYIVSRAGFLRYIPFIFAFCAAGILQLAVLEGEVTFRIGLLIALIQWSATAVAGYIVALLMGVAFSNMSWTPAEQTAPSQAQANAGAKQPKSRPEGRRPQQKKAKSAEKGDASDNQAATASASLQQMIEEKLGEATAEPREQLSQAGENLKEYADSHLEDLKEEMEPLTKHLPEPVRSWLDKGGWWWVIGALVFFALLWVRSIFRRLREGMKVRQRRKKRGRKGRAKPVKLREDLGWIGEGYTEDPYRITVSGLPARLRLVVMSMGTRGDRDLSEDMVDRVLDWMKPGLAEVGALDQPGVRVWPTYYGFDGFATGLQANVPIPEPKGMKSHWVLVAGDVRMGKVIIHVGLAFYAREANSLRLVKVKGERWPSTISIEAVKRKAARGAVAAGAGSLD